MNLHIVILIIIIVGMGFLGGLARHLITTKNDFNKTERLNNAIKSVLLGICASITVPLFLHLLASEIIVWEEDFAIQNYFLFAGFCVVAAIFSKKYLDKLYDKVISLSEEEENIRTELYNNAIQGNDEIPVTVMNKEIIKIGSSITNIDKVLECFKKSKYIYMTVDGIVENSDNELDKGNVERLFIELSKTGYAKRRKNNHGEAVWRLIAK